MGRLAHSWEKPNDAGSPEIDESPEPTPAGYLFVMDSPGFHNLPRPPARQIKLWQYFNFSEFVRVGLKGQRPDMSGFQKWSICSGYVDWHSRIAIEWNHITGHWERMATGGDNEIAPGWVLLPESP